jgi:chromosome segregation ATPase
MGEEIERQIKEAKKALLDLRKKVEILRFRPCRGDRELRQKDEALEELQEEIQILNKKATKLEKELREARFGLLLKSG